MYVGRLRHRRFRPRPHAFTYDLFMALIDVDAVADQMTVSALTACNRFNWASFDDRDHLGDPARPLRDRVREDAEAHGVPWPGGPIYLLTHLRYLGYAFNPISFYYCCAPDGRVEAVMGEVHNTFGGLCTYWLTAASTNGTFQVRTPKVMHVSPFMGMDIDYEFTVTSPGDSLVAHMNTVDRSDGTARPFFDATLTLERRPWAPVHIRRALWRHPAMTAKVIGAIHWEALRLWAKGLPFYPNPKDDGPRKEQQEAVRP